MSVSSPCSSGSGRSMTNYARIGHAAQQLLPEILQDVLALKKPQHLLHRDVCNYNNLLRLLDSNDVILIKNAATNGYANFDVTLIYKLVRNLKLVQKPSQKWDSQIAPAASETTPGDDIERFRRARNAIVHRGNANVTDTEMNDYFSMFKAVARRLERYLGKQHGDYVSKFEQLETCCIDEKTEKMYLQALEDLRRRESDLTKKVKDVSMEVKENTKKVDDVSMEVKENTKKLDDVSLEVKENTKKLDDVSLEVKENTMKLDDVSMEVKENTKKVNDVTMEVMENTKKVDDVSLEVKENTKKVDDVSMAVKENTKKVDAVTMEVNVNTKKLDDVSMEVKENTKKVDDVSIIVKENTKKVDDVSVEVNENTKKVDVVSMEVKDNTKKVDDVSMEVKENTKKVDVVSKEVKETTKKVDDVSLEVKENTKKVDDISMEVKENTKDIAKIKKDINNVIKNQDTEVNKVVDSGDLLDSQLSISDATDICVDASPLTPSVDKEGKRFSLDGPADGVVLHSSVDRDGAFQFIQSIEQDMPDLKVKLLLYEQWRVGDSWLRSASKVFDTCRYLFIFVTTHFVHADLERFQVEIALIESISSHTKKYRVIPVLAEKSCNLPELRPLRPLNYYMYLEAKAQNKNDKIFLKTCVNLIIDGREKYLAC